MAHRSSITAAQRQRFVRSRSSADPSRVPCHSPAARSWPAYPRLAHGGPLGSATAGRSSPASDRAPATAATVSIPPAWRSGTSGRSWHGMSAASVVTNRCWIWSTTWTCWRGSRVAKSCVPDETEPILRCREGGNPVSNSGRNATGSSGGGPQTHLLWPKRLMLFSADRGVLCLQYTQK